MIEKQQQLEIARIEVTSYKTGHTITGATQVKKFIEATGDEISCISPRDNSELMLMQDAHIVRTHVIGKAADGVHTAVMDFMSHLLSSPMELFGGDLETFIGLAQKEEWPENGPRIIAFFALYEVTSGDDGVTFGLRGVVEPDERLLELAVPIYPPEEE